LLQCLEEESFGVIGMLTRLNLCMFNDPWIQKALEPPHLSA